MNARKSDRIRQVSSGLEREVREELRRRKLGAGELAERLGLLPVGAEVLLARQDWSLETSLQVAEAVGLEVELRVSRGK